MIVALARKLLIALWRFVREGVVPDGVVLRPAPLQPTPKAIQAFNRSRAKKIGLFHVTC
jgi:hypothetical protein